MLLNNYFGSILQNIHKFYLILVDILKLLNAIIHWTQLLIVYILT